MIRLPNLDDQTYEDIVETARRRVIQYFPEWTNFNPSDPGLTIIELFAWLKEMQQYHLNRMTRDGILACLRLLGLSPLKAAPAELTAVFRQEEPFRITAGCPFVTDDGLLFETYAPVTVGGASISAVWIDAGGGLDGLSGAVNNQELAIEPFGPDEREGACLYIGFSEPVMPELRLYFEIYNAYAIARTPFGDDLEPARDIEWEYGPDFCSVAAVADMTRGFSVSGDVTIKIDGEWPASKPAQEMPECCWLRARLKRRGAEESPRIMSFFKDFTTLYQIETLSCVTAASVENGILTLEDHLGIHGEHILFAAMQDGWKHLPIADERRFEDRAEISVENSGQYRAVSIKSGFNAFLSTETNLPGIRLVPPVPGYFEKIELMIEDGGIWRDWEYTEQLHTAGPHDRVFSFDEASGSLLFGDNEHGACPPAGLDNVLIAACRVTGGAEGNVLSHTLAGAQADGKVPIPDNIMAAEGGRDAEKIEGTLRRVSELLSARNCVTREDYEKAAVATPGTRILKARAIEGYDPKTGGMNIPALVTVVIQPYGSSERPLPDERMLRRVMRHLEKGRLLTARVEVAPPEYVPVSVRVDAICAESGTATMNVRESLLRFLSPVDGALGIGEPVLVSDIAAAIAKCAGISHVSGVMLSAPSNAAVIDRSGNVELPRHAIACPGEFDINIVES